MKRKVCTALALVGMLVLIAGRADATDPHYTDGTTFDGQVNYGPPPLDPSFSTPCAVAIVDPPASLVFVTLHFVYGTTMPPATVPVHDDASDVVNYVGSAPGTFLVDVSSFVDGKAGFLAYTWNIGTGVTAWVPFDCTPPTSTTIEGETSTSVPGTTTSTSIGPTGSTVPPPSSTTTSIGALGSTIPTTDASVPGSSTEQLPFTGGDTAPLTFAAVALLTAGAWLAARKRSNRD